MNLFRPAAVRSAAGVLDRSLFAKTIPLAAATVLDNKLISRYRRDLEKAKEICCSKSVRPDRLWT